MFTIITDSSADLLPSFIREQQDFLVVPMTYRLRGVTYQDGPEASQSSEAFYGLLRQGEQVVTSQVNVGQFCDAFRSQLKAGKQVLYLAFSSGLSGTYQSAVMAKNMMLEEFPDAQLELLDTLCASLGQGLFVQHALRLRAEGKTLLETRDTMSQMIPHMAHWFTVDDLNFLKRGGRCSPAAAFFGTMIAIKPVLHVDNAGKLIAREKVRGRKSALSAMVDKMAQAATDLKGGQVGISHGDCLEDAKTLASLIHQRLGVPMANISFSSVGPVIGCHSGPGTLALFFWAKDRG